MNHYPILFFLVFFVCCSKHNKQVKSESYRIDSISKTIPKLSESKITKINHFNILKSSLKNIEKFNNSFKKRKLISEIGFEFYDLNELESYKTCSRILLKNSTEANDSLMLAMSYRCLGGYNKDVQLYDSSFFYYNRAEKLYRKLNKPLDLANILLYKGIVQSNVNDLTGADVSLNQAYLIFKKTDNYYKTYAVLNQLGLVYRELKYFDKAIDYHNKALEIITKEKLNKNEEEALCYGNIGLVYEYKKDYKKANYFYKKSLSNPDVKKNNALLYAIHIDNYAYSNVLLLNKNNTLNLLLESLKIRDSINDPSYIILSYIHISEYYQKFNDYNNSLFYSKTSIDFANKALQLAKQNKNPLDIVAALKQAAAVNKLNASAYTQDFIRINDSLLTAERKNLDRFARIQLETDEVIKENKILDNKNQNLIYYLLGTILLFSAGFYTYNEKQKQKIFILKQEQQASNQRIFNLLISQQENSVNIRIEEQKRIAKELHDGVLGRLFGTRLFIDSVNKSNSKEAIEGRSAAIVEMQSIEQQIREISHDMNSEKGKIINNFVGIVIDLLENQKKAYPSELHYSFGVDITWDKLDNFAKINLYRILQESLQNSNKYANAKSIEVLFKEIDEKIVLTITDDGKGFDVNKGKKGIGMSNMKERAEESGGIYEVVSAKNAGTTTTVTLPTNLKQQTTS